MKKTTWCFWCRLLGHKFKKTKDLRQSRLKRPRVVYHCSRCSAVRIARV